MKKAVLLYFTCMILPYMLIACDSVSSTSRVRSVIENDYSNLKGFTFTSIAHGWQTRDERAKYRVSFPSDSTCTVWSQTSNDIVLDSIRLYVGSTDSLVKGGLSLLNNRHKEQIEQGIIMMEQKKMHYFRCSPLGEVKCRLWVFDFWWIDLYNTAKNNKSLSRWEFHLKDGWILNVYPPTEWDN